MVRGKENFSLPVNNVTVNKKMDSIRHNYNFCTSLGSNYYSVITQKPG